MQVPIVAADNECAAVGGNVAFEQQTCGRVLESSAVLQSGGRRLQRLRVSKIDQDDVAGEHSGAAIWRHEELVYRRRTLPKVLGSHGFTSAQGRGTSDERCRRVGQHHNVDVKEIQCQHSCPIGQGANVRRSDTCLHVDDTVAQVGAARNLGNCLDILLAAKVGRAGRSPGSLANVAINLELLGGAEGKFQSQVRDKVIRRNPAQRACAAKL